MIKELICISCPMGCALTVDCDGKEVKKISGNSCERGIKYATEEIQNPRRTLTTTVRVKNCGEMLCVKSSDTLPKDRLFEFMEIINNASPSLPVHIGDVIIKDIRHTGVDIVATKNLD